MKSRLIKIFVLFVLFIGVVNTVNADDGILLKSNAIDTVLKEKSINKSEFISLAGGTPTLGNIVYACMTMKNNSESECKSLVNDIVAEHNKTFETQNQEPGVESVAVSGTEEKTNYAAQKENEELSANQELDANQDAQNVAESIDANDVGSQEYDTALYDNASNLLTKLDPYLYCMKMTNEKSYSEYINSKNAGTPRKYVWAKDAVDCNDGENSCVLVDAGDYNSVYNSRRKDGTVLGNFDHYLHRMEIPKPLAGNKVYKCVENPKTDNGGKDNSLAKNDDMAKKTISRSYASSANSNEADGAVAISLVHGTPYSYKPGSGWERIGDQKSTRRAYVDKGFKMYQDGGYGGEGFMPQQDIEWQVLVDGSRIDGKSLCSKTAGNTTKSLSSLVSCREGDDTCNKCWCSGMDKKATLYNTYPSESDCKRGCSKYCAEQVLNGNASF